MNDFQRYIDKGAPPIDPDEEFRVKDGAHFEQWLYFWWGRDGKLTGGQRHDFIQLAKKYTWAEVYEMVKTAAGLGGTKMCFRYVEKSLEGKAKQAIEKATAQKKKIVHCSKCYEGYWSDQRHECTIEFLDDVEGQGNPAPTVDEKDVHEQVLKIKEQWRNELD